MSHHDCDYVRRHYKVPAEIGRRVIANVEPGVIMTDRGCYIGVILDSDPKKRIRNYHLPEKCSTAKWLRICR